MTDRRVVAHAAASGLGINAWLERAVELALAYEQELDERARTGQPLHSPFSEDARVGDSAVTGKSGAASAAERMRAYRKRHPERVREADRLRDRSRRYDANPEQKRAWNKTAAAIRRGKLIPGPCERCGATPAQAHHDDYAEPLVVRWLCRPHHEELHAALRVEPAEVSPGEGPEEPGQTPEGPLPVREQQGPPHAAGGPCDHQPYAELGRPFCYRCGARI